MATPTPGEPDAATIHFEIIAPNPAALASFYQDVVGWTVTKWDGPMDYWLAPTGDDAEPGIHGGLTCLDDGPPAL